MNESRMMSGAKILSACFLLLWCLFPLVWMVVISVSSHPEMIMSPKAVSVTFNHFTDILTNESLFFPDFLVNSVVVSTISAALATILASFSAYAISRFSFPGRFVIPVALLFLSMFPPVSLTGYLFEMITAMGLMNTYGALVFPYSAFGLPLGLWILLNGFSRIPREMDEAAVMEGATPFQVFHRILLPLALPGIASAFLLIFIQAYNEFLFALILTADEQARTLPVGIALFEGLHGQIPWGSIMAASVMGIFPVIGLVLLFQRMIVQGITRGAVKG